MIGCAVPFKKVIRDLAGERSQFVKFVAAAGLSVPVNLASRALFSLVTYFEAAVALSHFCGMTTAYTLTKLFVFEPTGRPVASEFTRFAIVNAASLVQTWIVAVGLVRLVWPFFDVTFYPELTAHFIGLSSSAVTSYFGHKKLSFARTGTIAER
jgi:putative flippase GtrA